MTASAVSLDFRVGARTLWSVRRPLRRVALSLDEALAGVVPTLPPLGPGEQGWLVTSLPENTVEQSVKPGFLIHVRQRYARHHTDLTGTHADWLSGLSGNARSVLRRKRRKLESHPEPVEVRRFAEPEELRTFHALARPLVVRTYQERLMGMGLPADAAFLAEADALAAADRVRAWLMTLGGRPIAYLWCAAEGGSLRYDYVGYDPAYADLSPGALLHAQAFADLFAERRFARFDFTEGEGQHKRQFATGAVACADVLLLRDTLSNRALAAVLRGFDAGIAFAKRLARHPRLARAVRRLRRAP